MTNNISWVACIPWLYILTVFFYSVELYAIAKFEIILDLVMSQFSARVRRHHTLNNEFPILIIFIIWQASLPVKRWTVIG
jgi:hypothetical protein